jgi:hypothetical protein
MQRNLESSAEQRQIAAEKRANERALSAESRQQVLRQQYGGILGEVMKVVQDPSSSPMQKIGSLQQYAAMTGDTKSVAPILNEIIKSSTKQREAEANYQLYRPIISQTLGIDLPEKLPSDVTPGAITGLSQFGKPTFEPESDKIEAKRSADFADQIIRDYNAAEISKNRLAQMDIAAKSGQLPTPAMMKTMDFIGIPLSIFSNPLAEAYDKNVNEYIKDIANYFPGQIRVAEIEPYMKTIPTLLNSDAGKELIIENQQLINEQKEATYEAYKEILKENKGKKPRNLDVEILERTKAKRQEIGDRLKGNFEKAIQMSKFPTGKVNAGTKLTPNTALNYLNAAGGDRKKAEEMARKDGYEF